MKNKYLLTVKYALASMVLGVLGLVGGAAISEKPAAASDVVLSIVVDSVPYSLTVNSPLPNGAVGDSFSLNLSGENIDTVAVYVDLNGDNNYEASELLGTFNIATGSTFGPDYFVGPVTIPTGLAAGLYNMKVVGVQYNGGDTETSVIIPIDFSSTAPQVDNIEKPFGSTAGGDNIIITGKNFDASSKVYIGGNECLNIVVESATKITCTTPAGPAGHAVVRIDGPNGTYTDAYGFLYVQYATGGGGGFMPNVPNTGLFRVGNTVVMSSDLLIAGLTIVIIVLGVILVKRNKQCKKPARKPTKNGAKAAVARKAPAKRVRSKKTATRRK
jgi:hypothetical protein